ncbi:MAG: hypothetical protein ACP5G0_08960 [Desulfomonilia bacterium]
MNEVLCQQAMLENFIEVFQEFCFGCTLLVNQCCTVFRHTHADVPCQYNVDIIPDITLGM